MISRAQIKAALREMIAEGVCFIILHQPLL